MKRIFSFVLCMVMLFSLLPLQASATEIDPADLLQQYAKAEGPMSADADIDYSDFSFISESGAQTRDVGDHSYREEEPNDTLSTADKIYSDYTISGTLSSSDTLDCFRFYVSSPSYVTIVAAAEYSSYALGVHDSSGEVIGADMDGEYYNGSYMYELYGKLSGGTYYLSMLDTYDSYNTYTFYILIEPIKLDAPTVKATNRASDGKIKLSWNKIDGAKEYKVYRATSKDGTYKLLKTTTSTSFTNTSTTAGKKYYYKVKAIHSDSAYNSKYSEVVSRYCDLPQPEAKATNVASSGKIKVSWNKIDGAEEYKVYRATSKDGEYKLVKTTTSTSYTNTSATAGKTYYYKVKAIHSKSDANSAYSEIVSRRCDLARPSVTISLKNGDPKLTWKKVEGAKEYKIYRATAKDGDYELMKTTTSTSYTNTSAKAGKTYYYKVKAIHSNSNANSAYSLVDSIKAK